VDGRGRPSLRDFGLNDAILRFKRAVPEDFVVALRRNTKAKAFFDSLNKANLYAITYRQQTAKKPETRQKRMETILAMLAKGKAFHA